MIAKEKILEFSKIEQGDKHIVVLTTKQGNKYKIIYQKSHHIDLYNWYILKLFEDKNDYFNLNSGTITTPFPEVTMVKLLTKYAVIYDGLDNLVESII